MNKEKWKGLLHLAAGLVVLYHGFDNFEKAEFLSAAAYFSFALLYMLIAALHNYLTRLITTADTAFFLLEAITILYSAWHYKIKEHTFIFVLFAIIGIVYLVLSVTSIHDADKPRTKRRRRHKRRSSSTE